VADKLSELTDLLRGDPGFGEASEAQQIDQVLSVTEIVRHPPIAPGVAEGVSETDGGVSRLV
jgi:hypothetical protein